MTVEAASFDHSELNKVIAPEIKHDAFYELIKTLAATEKLEHVLEIGSSSGAGSTEAFVAGLSRNPGTPKLFCIEVSGPRFDELRRTYAEKTFVHCYRGSSVRVDEFPDQKAVVAFYEQVDCGLRKYPLPQVLNWLTQDIRYIAESGVDADVIETIKCDHGIDKFDMVLIDGSEFTGEVEYNKIKGARLILLDDTNTYKCYNVRKLLIDDPMYDVIVDDQTLRNGYSAFRRRARPRRIGDTLPIHFFTIVLNGEPFIRYHESVLSRLTVPWHWHIVEGVAALNHDTAWSVAGGGRVADELHDRGRSKDGTSAYIDELAQRFPDNITIYRKPLGEFWDGKREMVNAPLPTIDEHCLLWQIDNDELWTLEQIRTVHDMFRANPDRTAASYWCWYYVGPTKIISTRYNYAQNPAQEWLRTWRYSPGSIWAAHEPPTLVKSVECKTDIAKINPFTQDEMERAGAVFHHFAYACESQLQFKEVYYGYGDAREQWRALQAHSGSGKLSDHLGWVTDETMFDDISHYPVTPLARVDASGKWTFSADDRISDEMRSAKIRPRILVDGVFWQHLSSGIARVWENLLKEWVASGFADHVIVLDRAATAPRISGVHYWTIAPHEYAQTGADSLYLEEVCQRLGADLFVSTYYSTPTTTPSFFSGYDMIPEMLGFPMTDETWQEKRRAIIHAAGHSMISANSARDLEGLYPDLPRGQTYVAPVGVAPEFSPPSPHVVETFRAAHGLGDKPYVIMVGERFGFGGYKNGTLAFRALAQMPAECPLALICVGGQPDIEQELQEIAPQLDAHRLSLPDAELAAAYAGAHCLLYPSKYEGFGMPPLEAMACRAPAIVCRNSSLPEVVGDAAIFVDESDPADTVKALLSLFDPTIRADLIAKGLAQAAKFTFARMAKIFADALIDTHRKLERSEITLPGAGWGEFRRLQRSQQNLPRQSDAPALNTLTDERAKLESGHSFAQPSVPFFPQQSAEVASETFIDAPSPRYRTNNDRKRPISRFFKRMQNSVRKRTRGLASSLYDLNKKLSALSKWKRKVFKSYYLVKDVRAMLPELRSHLSESKAELVLVRERREQENVVNTEIAERLSELKTFQQKLFDIASLAPKTIEKTLNEIEQNILREQHRTFSEVNTLHSQITSHADTIIEMMPSKETDRGRIYYNALHGVGVLNYQNDLITGEHRFIQRFVEQYPKAIVFDVGANSGQYARLVRSIGPQTTVHSFEPHPVSFEKLAKAAAIDGFTAHNFALGNKRSEIDFFDYADEAGSQHASVYRDVIEGVHRRPAASQKVRCETLDAVVTEMEIASIDLLKIDTEGHEFAVLRGAKRMLKSGQIDVIQFEFNEMNVISRVFMKDFFDLLPNYRFFRLLENGVIELPDYEPNFVEIFAFQNIVCIRRDRDHHWVY